MTLEWPLAPEWLLASAAFCVGALDGLTTHIGLTNPRLEETNSLWRRLHTRMPAPVFILAMGGAGRLLSIGLFQIAGLAAQIPALAVQSLAPLWNGALILRTRRKT